MDEKTKIQSVGSIEPNRCIDSLCHKCVFYDADFRSCIFPAGYVDRKIYTDGFSIFAVISCCSFEEFLDVVLDDLPF